MAYDYAQQGYEDERVGFASTSAYTHSNPEHIDITTLESMTMEDYGLTPAAVRAYMFGLSVQDPQTGEPMGDEFYLHTLENAVAQAEQKFDIAIFPRIETEHHDYNSTEFNSYMHTRVHKRPIIQLEGVRLEINGRKMYAYPSNWWHVYHLSGHVEVMPSPLSQANIGMLSGYPVGGPFGTIIRGNRAPQMIEVSYVAGLLPRKSATYNRQWEMPATLQKVILKLAIREIFELWGRLLIQPGLASTSLSIDGISQSMGTTQSAMYGAVSADINQINQDIAELEKDLHGYFGGNFVAV